MLVALTFCKLRQLVSKRDPRSPLINHPRVRKRAKNPRLFLPFFFFLFFPSYLPNSCKIHRSDAVNYSHGTNYHRLYNNHQVALPRLEIRISRESTINDNIALPPRLNCFFFFFSFYRRRSIHPRTKDRRIVSVSKQMEGKFFFPSPIIKFNTRRNVFER